MNENGFYDLWPTTVYKGEIDADLAFTIAQTLLQTVDYAHPPTDVVDKGVDILQDGPEIMQVFRDETVIPIFENYLRHHNIEMPDRDHIRVRSWVTPIRKGYMIPAHNHSCAVLSVVFYFLVEEGGQGDLVLIDPRANANRGYEQRFQHLFANKIYKPKSAEYIVFPSFLYHHTIPSNGVVRVAMPVDLFIGS